MTRLKLPELTSSVGALVLGIGLGALFATRVAGAAGVVAVAGVFVHAFGMWDKRRLETRIRASDGPIALALYWVCWVLLAGILVFLIKQ
jgi:hypothetical protein